MWKAIEPITAYSLPAAGISIPPMTAVRHNRRMISAQCPTTSASGPLRTRWFAHSRLLEPGDIFSCDSNPYQLPATRDHAVALDFETSMAIDRIPPDFEQGASHGSR
jgi:hypothetical protein